MKRDKQLQEELTTEMHSEFTVDAETDLKLRVFSALDTQKDTGWSTEKILDSYDLTLDQIEKYKPSYLELRYDSKSKR